jgi:hypothetical protein
VLVADACVVAEAALEDAAVEEDMVRGMPRIDHIDQICDSCLAGKQRQLPFPNEAKYCGG